MRQVKDVAFIICIDHIEKRNGMVAPHGLPELIVAL
jgi:hypothetical protein